MKWYWFVIGFVVASLLVDDLILRYKLKRAIRMRDFFNNKHLEYLGLEPIGEIKESPSDMAYLKERGFIR